MDDMWWDLDGDIAPFLVQLDLSVVFSTINHVNDMQEWSWETVKMLLRNGQIRDSIACSCLVYGTRGLEGILPEFWAIKGATREIYFHTCKILLIQFFNKLELVDLAVFPV